jgi:hypothetical protein
VDIELSEAEIASLDEVSAMAPEYPQWIAPPERGTDLFERLSSLIK